MRGILWGLTVLGIVMISHSDRGILFAQTSRIDLEIESIQIQPPRPSSKQPVLVAARIRNNGSEPAENLFVSVTLRRGAERIRTIKDVPVLSHLPRMGSGLSESVEIGTLAPGSYEIEMKVYTADPALEPNMNNNSRTNSFQVS